jgi:hypothetical protein
MDYLWECLVKWEEAGGPEDVLGGGFRPAGRPVTQVEELYVIGFNDLRKSCRLHRKESGPRGYVKYVQEWVTHVLDQDPELEDLLDPTIPALQSMLDFEPLLEKRGYRISLHPGGSGIPHIDEIIFDDDRDEDLTVSDIEGLLHQSPDNPFLRSELARATHQAGRKEEAIAQWKALMEEYPDHPHYISAYLDLLLDFDQDRGYDEAERLDFQFELNEYPFDQEDGYSVVVLLYHSSACLRMAIPGQDMDYAMELFDDLLATGLPRELLTKHGMHFLMHLLRGEEIGNESAAREVLSAYPQFPHATAMLGDMMEQLAASVNQNREEE